MSLLLESPRPGEANDSELQPLQLHELYAGADAQFFGLTFNNSTAIAAEMVSQLLSQVGIEIEDRILRARLPTVSKAFITGLLERVVIIELNEIGAEPKIVIPDEEPELTREDNWGRYQLLAHKKNEIDPVVDHKLPERSQEIYFSVAKSVEKAVEKAKQHLLQIDANSLPVPVNLYVEEEVEKNEEIMRNEKESKLQKIQSELMKQKLEEDQANLERMKFQKSQNEIRKKTFTYDFDGKMLLCTPLNPEKLPPTNFSATHRISNAGSTQDDKTPKRRLVGILQAKQIVQSFKQSFNPDAAILNYPAPAIYEHFEPKAGVLLKDNGRTKKGFAFSGLNATATLPSLYSTGTSWGKITRNDYENLMKTGNTHRNSVMKLENTMSDMASATPKGKGYDARTPMNREIGFSRFEQSAPREDNSNKPMKVHSSRLLESLLKQTEGESIKIKLPEKKEPPRGVVADETLKKTTIDEFNLSIMNSKEWGKGGAFYIEPQNPGLLPGRRHRQQLSLGNMSAKVMDNTNQTMSGTFYSIKSPHSTRNRWISTKPVSRSTARNEIFF